MLASNFMNRRERRKQQHLARQRAAVEQRPTTPELSEPKPTAPAEAPPDPAPSDSIGPRTAAGKAVSSRNASKHNLCARRLTGSDLEEYNAIRAAFAEEWCPLPKPKTFSSTRWPSASGVSTEPSPSSSTPSTPITSTPRYLPSPSVTALPPSAPFYKALTELQRLRANQLAEQRLEARAAEAQLRRELDRLCFAPFAPAPAAPQFVSQNMGGALNHHLKPQLQPEL
jgi:hypothetical protein